MKANDLKALIDKAIGKRGIFRTPAWWVRKIFYELVDSDKTLSDRVNLVEPDAASAKTDIANIKIAISQPFIIEWTGDLVSLALDDVYTEFNSESHKATGYFWKSIQTNYSYGRRIVRLDLSKVKIRYGTTMASMFSNCSSLQSLDFSGFDTSAVTDMASMFYSCSSLQSLDLSGFDTSQVTTMYDMFSNCSSLQSLDLSMFNTSKVTDMTMMFFYCSSLQSLDLSGFDTSQVTTMYDMFFYCPKLTALTLSAAFFNSASLTTYDFSGLTAWTDADSLAALVEALPTITAAKTIKLSANTKAALTDGQKETITTTKGWTIA